MSFLRTSIGDDNVMGSKFASQVALVAVLLEGLTKFQDTQMSLHLLRACFNVCEINNV